MSRRSNSYASVVRGVSEQVPQDRRPGQHYEQINLISDPVRGLARRHGSQMLGERLIRTIDAAEYSAMLEDTAGHKVFSFQCNGYDYDLIYRTRAITGQVADDFAWCFNKDKKVFIPIAYDNASSLVTALKAGGVNALANVGKYVFLAGATSVSSFVGTDVWRDLQGYSVAWVRGGAYSRTYTIAFTTRSGTVRSCSYTTPTSSYQGVLDTSDIPATAPDYAKQMNDRVNAYNSAVTRWIGTAAAAIVPAAIAEQLKLAALAIVPTLPAGVTTLGVDRVDSTVVFYSTGTDPIIEVTVKDGGDGTLFRGVGATVASAELTSLIHIAGKIIQVRPKLNDGSDVYYLKATPKVDNATGWVEVVWREAAGYEVAIKDAYCMATVATLAGVETLCIGGSNTSLATLTGGTHPGVEINLVGDRASSPIPEFVGKSIDYMGMFQDRLVIASGAVLFFSRSGDYQNFWRQSVLAVDDSDPVEMFALGAENDTIRATTTYDRNLLIFGKRKQYVVSGRAPLTPRTASVVVQSAHEDAVDSFPINSGNFVFYNKYRNGIATAHQVQIGQLVDTPESYEISKQLDRYLRGRPIELVAVTSPNVLFMRTETQRDRFYVFTYLDSAAGSERLFDSWSTWQMAPRVGALTGLSRHEGDIFGYFVRRLSTGATYIVCDKYVLDTEISDYPYLDSLRPYTAPGTIEKLAGASMAFDVSVPEYLLGAPYLKEDEFTTEYPDLTEATWLGLDFTAYVTPTNPYILDQNGKAIVTGRLTLTKFAVSIADSGGLRATMHSKLGDRTLTDFTGRLIGGVTNLVGRAPIVTTSVSVPVGREVRDFTYTLAARTWLPLTITAIEWTGQFFNNTRRG